jgi:hypothetical protein
MLFLNMVCLSWQPPTFIELEVVQDDGDEETRGQIHGQADENRGVWQGGHGLPKVSLGLAKPGPSTPCGQAIPETALWPFEGWTAHSVGGLQPSFTTLDTPCRTPMDENNY